MASEIETKKSEEKAAANHSAAQVEVRLFRIAPDFDYAEHLTSLSEEERQRAARMMHPRFRAGFVAARTLLRKFLAARLGCAPAEVPIIREASGKPRLKGGEIEFSLSHPEGWCALAVSEDCPLGVDVEPVRALPDQARIAAEFFSREAQSAFLSAPLRDRQAEFFRWWTRLEAAAKVFGRGLDDAPSLDGVVYESYDALPGVALSVAAQALNGLEVHWHVTTCSTRLGN